MVPKNLMTEQKANQRDVFLDLLYRLEKEPDFFSCSVKTVVTSEALGMQTSTLGLFGRSLESITAP
jgi:hypothetical protein